MGKLLAVVLTIFTLGSVAIFVWHPWWMPADISTEGPAIDRQIADTLFASGILFVLGQLLLATFVWRFSENKRKRSIQTLPGGATLAVTLAVVLVGVEITALTFVGSKVWASIYITPATSRALKIDVQAEQFAFHFRYAGADGLFGMVRPDLIDDAGGNFFGLDKQEDPAAKDDIVTGTLMVPVNRQISLTLRSHDVGHSFFVPELRIQQDFVPGLSIPVHFTATKIGKYEIVCTQLCGLGHAVMRAYMEVLSPDQFDRWLAAQASP